MNKSNSKKTGADSTDNNLSDEEIQFYRIKPFAVAIVMLFFGWFCGCVAAFDSTFFAVLEWILYILGAFTFLYAIHFYKITAPNYKPKDENGDATVKTQENIRNDEKK